ncbi:hypothetical protein AB0I84_23535 [Streptomyces spectabilis]
MPTALRQRPDHPTSTAGLPSALSGRTSGERALLRRGDGGEA